jgi:drug/metabolite transporter (DMT)-like permease
MKEMSVRDTIELILLSAVWGSSFLFLRVAAPEFGPVFLVEIRVLTALIVLLPICIYLGSHQEIVNNWEMILIASLTNMSIPFCLFAFAALFLNAGFASTLNTTVPFFSAIIAFLLFRHKMRMGSIFGLFIGFIGFIGVVVLVLDPANTIFEGGSLLAVSFALVACALYGLAINLVANRLQNISGLAITTGSLFYSSIFLFPFAIWQQPETMPEGSIWLSVVALGVFCTGAAYIMFYRLIARIGSHRAIMTAYLVPLFSLLWGNIFLAEKITLFMGFGFILILLGVGLTTGKMPRIAILTK